MNGCDLPVPATARVKAAAVLLVALLAGCVANRAAKEADRAVETPVYEHEAFQRETPYWRAFPAKPAEICESARQALMSQGYLIAELPQNSSPPPNALIINGRKFIEPGHGAEIELAINVTCAAAHGAVTGIAYVTAWEDHLVTKRNSTPTSVGVGPVGSISLPLSSAEDALVKVGVNTITDQSFYDRFYKLIDELLPR